MGSRDKRLSDLQRQARRRSELQIAQPKPQHLKASDRERDEMVRDHLDVLQNIEAVITTYADTHDIDDRMIRRALEAAITQTSLPANTDENWLLQAIRGVRQFRSETSEEVWDRALRVVLTSVKNHSSCAPGDDDYLEFIRNYT